MGKLERFLDAQANVYDAVVGELREGRKQGHWMWFVFPQLAGLGRSDAARHYALSGLAEAREYLADPVLASRLAECTDAVLAWAGRRSAESLFGMVDALKFASSMTLFEAAGGDSRFGAALDAFFGGKRDERTLSMLGRDN